MSLTQADTERVLEAMEWLDWITNPANREAIAQRFITSGAMMLAPMPGHWQAVRKALQQAAEDASEYGTEVAHRPRQREWETVCGCQLGTDHARPNCPVPLYAKIANHEPGGGE